jgi:hypothetical protein
MSYMSVTVGTLYRKSILRDMSGNIINLRDETNGGWIIQNRQVVNQEKFDELVKIEQDRQTAALAESQTIQAPAHVVENRSVAPGKLEALEKRISEQDSKLDAILAALSKKTK